MYPQSTCNNCHLKVTYMYSITYCILSYSTMVLVSCSFFVYCLCCCVLFVSWFIGIRWHWQQYDNYLEMRLALRCRSVDLESLGTTCCPSWCLLLPDRTTSWTETAHSVSHPPPHSIWYLHSFVHCYSHITYYSNDTLACVPWSCSDMILLISVRIKSMSRSTLLNWQLQALQESPWASAERTAAAGERTNTAVVITNWKIESIVTWSTYSYNQEYYSCYNQYNSCLSLSLFIVNFKLNYTMDGTSRIY